MLKKSAYWAAKFIADHLQDVRVYQQNIACNFGRKALQSDDLCQSGTWVCNAQHVSMAVRWREFSRTYTVHI